MMCTFIDNAKQNEEQSEEQCGGGSGVGGQKVSDLIASRAEFSVAEFEQALHYYKHLEGQTYMNLHWALPDVFHLCPCGQTYTKTRLCTACTDCAKTEVAEFMAKAHSLFTPSQLHRGVYQRALLFLFMKRRAFLAKPDATSPTAWIYFVYDYLPTLSHTTRLSHHHYLQVVGHYCINHHDPNRNARTLEATQYYGRSLKILKAILIAIRTCPSVYTRNELAPFLYHPRFERERAHYLEKEE